MERIEKPLITVVGATSKQGRSVVNSLMQSQRFRVRTLTRRKDSKVDTFDYNSGIVTFVPKIRLRLSYPNNPNPSSCIIIKICLISDGMYSKHIQKSSRLIRGLFYSDRKSVV